MALPYKLYIDTQGVKRGYYVYVHKDRTTGEVFYVGKGNGKRAWETCRRNDKWKKKVTLFTNGWDVELVKEDLSEIEAFELEAELVEQYGGSAVDGGRLTNKVSGGENPLSIQLGIQFDDGGWSAAYNEARKFKEFPRCEKETLVEGLNKELDIILQELQCLEQTLGNRYDEKSPVSITNIDCLIRTLHDVSFDFLRHRVSWKDFALTLEETLDDLKLELEDMGKYHKKLEPLLKQAFHITTKVLLEIDLGNRKEAEEIANCKTRSG